MSERKVWPLPRREQYMELVQLLSDVSSLNSANRAIDKLHGIIDRAKHLSEPTGIGKPSFLSFLRDLAVGEPSAEVFETVEDDDYDPA